VSKPWRVRDEADEEIELALGKYELERKGLGRALYAEYMRAYAGLQDGTLIATLEPDVPRELRVYRARLRKFRYVIIFTELDDVYEVISFMHQHREPSYWLPRLVK
jgi:hypothetical protein